MQARSRNANCDPLQLATVNDHCNDRCLQVFSLYKTESTDVHCIFPSKSRTWTTVSQNPVDWDQGKGSWQLREGVHS